MKNAISREVALGFFNDPLLSEADASALVLAVGPLFEGVDKEGVRVAINNAAAEYALAYYKLTGPSLDVAAAEADDLREKCVAVLKSAGITPPVVSERDGAPYVSADKVRRSLAQGGLFGFARLDEHEDGAAAVTAALHAVADLERWSRRLADWRKRQRANRPSNSAKVGADADTAFGPFLDRLEAVYLDAWDWIAHADEAKLRRLTETGAEWNPRATVTQPKKSARADKTGRDWRRIYEDAGTDPSVDDVFADATIEAADTLASSLSVEGDPMPERFLRLLCEVMFRVNRRGLPVRFRPGALERRWYRWQQTKREAAAA